MSKQNRRSFIRKSVGTTSALVALGQARFAHSQTEPKASTSPNEQMNVAIIGTGGRGGTHISEMLQADGVTISHICDVDEEKGSQRATQIEKAQGSRPEFKTDLRHILDVPSVDFVTIATPNHWHALGGIWAIQAGKDAYVEKPVCHNIAEGTALIAAARKYDMMCQVGTQCRSSQAIIDAISFMNAGGIGDVNFARGLCYKRRKSIIPLRDYAVPGTVDFNLWSVPAQYTDPHVTHQQSHDE